MMVAGATLATVTLVAPTIGQAAVTGGPRSTMIVLMKPFSLGTSHSLARSEARSIVANAISSSGGRVVSSLSSPNAVIVRVTAAEARALVRRMLDERPPSDEKTGSSS